MQCFGVMRKVLSFSCGTYNTDNTGLTTRVVFLFTLAPGIDSVSQKTSYNQLNNGHVMPYVYSDLGKHWHQAITWTNVDLPSVNCSGIHMSQQVLRAIIWPGNKKYLNHQWQKLALKLVHYSIQVSQGLMD